MPAQRLITFTTDFGVNDHFVGTMKGVIYQINPAAQIVDICNGVNSFDILDGALARGALMAACGLALIGLAARGFARAARRATAERERPA